LWIGASADEEDLKCADHLQGVRMTS
jgi:hypothetical protein